MNKTTSWPQLSLPITHPTDPKPPSKPFPTHHHPSPPIPTHPNPSQPIPTTSHVCILLGCLRMCDNATWQNFANLVSPANLTLTARTASKFCARSWSQHKHIFDLDLISSVLLENQNLHVYGPRYPTMQRVRWSPVPNPQVGAGGRRRSP